MFLKTVSPRRPLTDNEPKPKGTPRTRAVLLWLVPFSSDDSAVGVISFRSLRSSSGLAVCACGLCVCFLASAGDPLLPPAELMSERKKAQFVFSVIFRVQGGGWELLSIC